MTDKNWIRCWNGPLENQNHGPWYFFPPLHPNQLFIFSTKTKSTSFFIFAFIPLKPSPSSSQSPWSSSSSPGAASSHPKRCSLFLENHHHKVPFHFSFSFFLHWFCFLLFLSPSFFFSPYPDRIFTPFGNLYPVTS